LKKPISISQIAAWSNGDLRSASDSKISKLVVDSRKVDTNKDQLFFALKGSRFNGHQFIDDLYSIGLRNFVVELSFDTSSYPEANFVLVPSVINALQNISAAYRNLFSLPILAITGSNGKTTCKEWLYQLLRPDFKVVKSPKSYNSQIGVPLSVWQIEDDHELGIFEAGISQLGEMQNLANIIQPSIGLFTNLGPAHDEGFESRTQKLEQKLLLFQSCETIIYEEDAEVALALKDYNAQCFSWSYNDRELNFKGKKLSLGLEEGSVFQKNACHCAAVLLHLGIDGDVIAERIKELKPIPMRLEVKRGVANNILINDTYNNDLAALKIAIDYAKEQQGDRKLCVIVSDIEESGMADEKRQIAINQLLISADINQLITIGKGGHNDYSNADDLLTDLPNIAIANSVVLIKGSRKSQLERVVRALEQASHETIWEINLSALLNNLNAYRKRLQPEVKIMAMVKALAYGIGDEEVARLLQFQHIDYLGVAFTDEGIALRKAGINKDILVMNASDSSFHQLVEHNLQPEIFDLSQLKTFSEFLTQLNKEHGIHIKLETGMNRLGFSMNELAEVLSIVGANPLIQIKGIMSHFAASERADESSFSQLQLSRFKEMNDYLVAQLGYQPLRHMCNSAGIVNFPDAHMDMVRLGIGLYGIDSKIASELVQVGTLKTFVSQVKHLKPGDTVGYSRSFKADNDMVIAILPIGYADGLDRRLSGGKGYVLINDKKASIIGNVCMDMTMVDITDIKGVQRGDVAVVTSPNNSLVDMAKQAGTIPYVLLTNISPRIRRLFYYE